LSAHTLRYYEQLNLIEVERDASGHRRYSPRDAKWVRCVKRLRESGMPLKDIREFAARRHRCDGPDCPRLRILERHKFRLDALYEELLERMDLIDREIVEYKEWNDL